MASSERRVSIAARGHENVTAAHQSTLEVTGDDYLTPAGDCIVAIDADTVPTDLDEAFVAACQDPAATIRLTIETSDRSAVVTGRGHPDLTFESDRSMVCRTSTYVDDRTVLVDADAAAADLDRALVAELAAEAETTVRLAVDPA